MTLIRTTANGVTSEHEIDVDRPLTVLCHQQGIKVEVPEFVEINPKDTIRCMEQMDQGQWEWISQGQIFRTLFYVAFPEEEGDIRIPPTIADLNEADFGIIHVSGMIILGMEAMMAGKSVFVRNPETYLHPAIERHIADLFHRMLQMFGHGGKVTKTLASGEQVTETVEPPEKPPVDPLSNKQHTLAWLDALIKSKGENKSFAQFGGKSYTLKELVGEVKNDSPVGQAFVAKFVEMRDGR